MKTIRGKNINLSQINNINDLDAEIAKIELRIRQNKNEIKTDFKRLPIEAVRSSLGSVLPFFKKGKNAGTTFHLLQTLAGGIIAAAINTKKGKTTFKQGLINTVKQISFLETASAVIHLLRKKRDNG